MNLLVRGCVLLAGVYSMFAQSKPAALMPGMGQHHHSISTKSTEAQRFFDQGSRWSSRSTTKRPLDHSGGRRNWIRSQRWFIGASHWR